MSKHSHTHVSKHPPILVHIYTYMYTHKHTYPSSKNKFLKLTRTYTRMSSLDLLISLLTTLPLLTSSLHTPTNPPSVYQLLQHYNFPVGLLPVGVTRYELDQTTGKFKVYLDKTCEFNVQDYQLRYKSTISGTISKNQLKDLSGISVKVVLFWLNIGEVSRDGDELEFSVGVLSADFEVGNFEESPQCGCGFDCNGGSVGDLEEGATKTGLGIKVDLFTLPRERCDLRFFL